jgi:hypothetical protein
MDLMDVWFLPAAVLLPPVYALIAPAPFIAVDQWHFRGHASAASFSAATTAWPTAPYQT